MLSKIEISYFLKLFINNGYVLDFSTNDFDIFTTTSIEIPLCEKYELSKGKSLSAFCNESSNDKVQKLLLIYLSIMKFITSIEIQKKKTKDYLKNVYLSEIGNKKILK